MLHDVVDVINQRTVIYASTGGLPALPRVERIACERVSDPGYRLRLPRPGPTYAAIQVTLGGAGAVWHPDGRIQEISRGYALCLLTDRSRFIYGLPDDAREPWDFIFVEIHGAGALAVVGELVERFSPVVRCDPEHAVIRDLLRRVPSRGTRVAVMPPGESAALAMALLAALVDEQRDQSLDGEDRLCLAAMEHLRAHLDEPPGIAAVARRLGVSREHLTRLFTASCGESPARWLHRQRLAEADRLVRGGTDAIAEIARRCGFATASHFIHCFKRQYGRTPAEHRRQR